ncbi:uncharacterized protein RBU33_023487 isoform 2-T2 [Hipposideros larvatus]
MAETQVPPMLPQCWSSEPVIPLVGSGDIVRKRRKTLQDSDDNGGSDETFNLRSLDPSLPWEEEPRLSEHFGAVTQVAPLVSSRLERNGMNRSY